MTSLQFWRGRPGLLLKPSGSQQWRRFGSKSGGDEEWSWRVRVGGRRQSLYIGGATILRMGYKTVLRAERAEIFFDFYPKLWHFWGTLVANEVKKLWNIFALKAKGSSCPLLARCLAKSGGQTTLRSPTRNSGGDSSPCPPVIYAPGSQCWACSGILYGIIKKRKVVIVHLPREKRHAMIRQWWKQINCKTEVKTDRWYCRSCGFGSSRRKGGTNDATLCLPSNFLMHC